MPDVEAFRWRQSQKGAQRENAEAERGWQPAAGPRDTKKDDIPSDTGKEETPRGCLRATASAQVTA